MAAICTAFACGDDAASSATETETDGGTGATETDDETGAPQVHLPPRPSTRTCRFDGHPPGLLPPISLEPAFGGLAFDDPVAMTFAPGRPETAWVAQADGRVLTFDRTADEPDATVAFDLALPSTSRLAAVAFAPDFDQSGHVFVRVHHDATPARIVIQRVTLGDDDAIVDGSTRTVLQIATDAQARHGGALDFDQTGMLVIGIGDGGIEDAMPQAAQDRNSRFGSLLRIDVSTLDDQGSYAIPQDNPFANEIGPAAETWAFGVRDPGHCAIDRADGTLWCSDLGQDEHEATRVPAGANLGWPVFEGKRCLGTQAQCEGLNAVGPVTRYDESEGDCGIVGGTVYRGAAYPELVGVYLHADRCSGRLRGVRLNAENTVEHDELLARLPGEPAAIGEDADGELYLLDGISGGVFRITVPATQEAFPTRLSESGCFEDLRALDPAPDVVLYEINAPLWTDDAHKSRHIVLPPGETITVLDDGSLEFPVGTYLLKTFSFEFVEGDASSIRAVETRVMIRREYTWEFHTYRWDDSGEDATLLDDGVKVPLTLHGDTGPWELPYLFPSRFECRTCHGSAPSRVLGPRIDQFDRIVTVEEGVYDQLAELEAIGMFGGPVPVIAPVTDYRDAQAPLEARARAYLHGNCGHCHRPGGWAPPEMTMDLRWSQPTSETQTCGVPPQYHNPWATGSHRITPGDPEDSLIWQRISIRGLGQMPPLATEVVDPDADVVRQWIESLETCPE